MNCIILTVCYLQYLFTLNISFCHETVLSNVFQYLTIAVLDMEYDLLGD